MKYYCVRLCRVGKTGYTVRIKKKVIHFQRSIVLKSINMNIRMWHTSKEQLLLFPLVPFLNHECHA